MLPARKFYGQNFMPDFFNDLFGNMSLEGSDGKSPAINVFEDEHGYKLELAAPGMCKEDFKVHINRDGNLVIELDKKCGCQEEKKGKYIRREFSCTKFHHTLILPDNVDKDGIKANVENGVLNISLPKLQKAMVEEDRRMIEIE